MINATARIDNLGPLIRYLEKALIKMPKISEDYQIRALWDDFLKIKALQERVEIFYRDDVEPFYMNFRVTELIELRSNCESFNKEL